jgi:hypothetical protein
MRSVIRFLVSAALALVTGLGAATVVASPASAACPIDDPDCLPGMHTYTSAFTVARSAGTVTGGSDSPSGDTIDCGSACTATDSQSDVSRPIDGWPSYTLAATGGPAGFSPFWSGCDSTPSPSQCVYANAATSHTITLSWIDVSAPTMTFNPPAKVGGGNLDVSASATDSSGVISRYDWTVDGLQMAAHGNTVSLSAFPDGTHTVSVAAVDGSNNVTSSGSRTVQIDRTVALDRVGAVPTKVTGAFTITFSTDGDVPPGNRECEIDDVGTWSPCTTGTSFVVPAGPMSLGSHTARIRVTDDVGNQTALATTFTRVATATLKAHPTTTRTHKGHRVTLVGTVAPAAAPGTVTFKQGSTTLCRGTLRSGVARCLTSAHLAKGLHRVTATYAGSSRYLPSTARTSFRII